MKRPHEDELRASLEEAHEPTRRGSPDFEGVWQAAERDAEGSGSGGWGRQSGASRLAIAAALFAVGVAGAVVVADSSNRSTNAPVIDPSNSEITGARAADGAQPFAEYDILDWESSTDVLLAHDDRLLEPPDLGNASWGKDWIELTEEELEEL